MCVHQLYYCLVCRCSGETKAITVTFAPDHESSGYSDGVHVELFGQVGLCWHKTLTEPCIPSYVCTDACKNVWILLTFGLFITHLTAFFICVIYVVENLGLGSPFCLLMANCQWLRILIVVVVVVGSPRCGVWRVEKVRKFWLPTVSVDNPAAKRQLPFGSVHTDRLCIYIFIYVCVCLYLRIRLFIYIYVCMYVLYYDVCCC